MPWVTVVKVFPPDASGAGTDITCLCDQVTINHGRDDSGSQPEASSFGADITVSPTDPLPDVVEIGSVLTVTQATGTVTSTRFAGRITDVALGWDDAGQETPDAGVGQLTAVGYLADTGRRVVGDAPYPQELDGARVQRVMTAAGFPLDPAKSDPGTVQILARDIDAQPALSVAQGVAQSGSGVVWETRAGEIRYADAMHRQSAPVALALDACDVLVTPTWRRTLEGLVNAVSIGYGVAPEGGEAPQYVSQRADSITRYGKYQYTATTELAALGDAQQLGELLLVRNGSPVWVMASLPVDTAGLDPARYDALLGLDMHSLVTLTGLPAIGTAPTSSATLWVEGWKETLTWQGHELELVVSGYCRTAPAPTWNTVNPGWTWGGATLTEQRRNVITNPSFEGGNMAGWSLSATATWAVDATTAAQGSSSMKATRTTGTVNNYNTPNLAAAAGEVWTFSFWYKTTSTAAAIAIVHFRNAADAIITQPTFPLPASATWVRVSGTFTAPVGTVGIRLNPLYAANGANGDIHWVDGVMAERAPAVGTYFDGATPDTADTDYAWAGTPNASASVQSAIGTIASGLPPTLTWDTITCLGPPVDYGRWNDQPASLRWDQLPTTTTWNNYTGA